MQKDVRTVRVHDRDHYVQLNYYVAFDSLMCTAFNVAEPDYQWTVSIPLNGQLCNGIRETALEYSLDSEVISEYTMGMEQLATVPF